MTQAAFTHESLGEQPESPGLARRGRGALIAFFVLWIAWSGALGWLRVSSPGLDHGDITTDSNILNAGENFDREGFWASWGVPALDTFRGENKTPDHYVTYPPGCYWLHQALKQVGVRELWHFRLVSVFWSSLAVLLFFVLCTRVSGAVLPAAIAATAYMLSRPFAEYADNLHYLSFSQVTLFATLLGWVGIEQARTSRGRMQWLLVAAAMFMLDSLVTFEHTLFIGAVGMARVVMTRRWGLLVPLMLLGLVPIGVLAARIGVNALALGSFADVWATMQGKFRQRTGATGAASWPQLGGELLDRLGWRWARSGAGSENAMVRIGVLSPTFLVPSFVLAVISLATWHVDGMRPARKAMGLAFALLLGGAMWIVVMREHAYVHAFTILLLLPGIASTIGALATFGWWQWRLQPRGAPVRMAGVIAGCILLVAHLSQMRHSNVLNLRWKLDDAVRQRNRDIESFETRFAQARPEFAGVKRMYMRSHDAQLGRKLHVAFDNDVGTTHESLASGEAQMIDWRDAARAMLNAESGCGPPRFLADPASHLAFFTAGRSEVGVANVLLSDGTRVTRVWLEPTLDGSGLIAGASVATAKDFGAAGLVMHIRARDVSGKLALKHSVQAENCAAATDRAVLWTNFIAPSQALDLPIEMWFTREGPGRLRAEREDARLPPDMHVGDGGRIVILRGATSNPPLP